MSSKSRAPEARRRRRVQREIRRMVEMARQADSTSSDDDMGNIAPMPLPLSPDNDSAVPRLASSENSDTQRVERQATPRPRASHTKSQQKPKRLMRGRRLLYGAQRVHQLPSDNTSPNDDSFSDNAAMNAGSAEDRTDSENDYGYHERPISSTDSSDSDDRSDGEGDTEEITLRERIAFFVTKYSLSVPATAELLETFKMAGVQGLPKDRRALLRTPRTIGDIIDKCGGTYKYFGLEAGLTDCLQNNQTFIPTDNTITFSVNIDGVPLFKSSSSQFWPLLCRVEDLNPFIVALYYGEKKPNNIKDYLEEFLDEYQQLNQVELSYLENRYNVQLKCWICDAQARCLLKCIKGHTGYYACERCKASGVYIERKITYSSNVVYVPRTDGDFAAMAYHNAPDGDTHQTGELCPLVDAGLNCVSDVIIDVMHNVYLGTWKRMLTFLLEGPRNVCRLSMNLKKQMNDKYLKLRLPSEFARQPRTIFELARWKATELRSSLLYTGYIFLKGVVSADMYDLYLKLTVAMNILHTYNEQRNVLLNFARELILEFIRDSGRLLGNDFIVYNVHCMSHIPDDIQRFQSSVNEISGFAFENHLQIVKKMVKGPCNPLAQVCARLGERAKQKYCQSAKVIEPHISTKVRDSMFYLENTHEFAMVQRRRRRDKKYDVLVFSADTTDDFFHRPCSSKLVNVFLVRNLDYHRATPRIVTKGDLHHKVVVLPCDNGVDYLLIPMLHESDNTHYRH